MNDWRSYSFWPLEPLIQNSRHQLQRQHRNYSSLLFASDNIFLHLRHLRISSILIEFLTGNIARDIGETVENERGIVAIRQIFLPHFEHAESHSEQSHRTWTNEKETAHGYHNSPVLFAARCPPMLEGRATGNCHWHDDSISANSLRVEYEVIDSNSQFSFRVTPKTFPVLCMTESVKFSLKFMFPRFCIKEIRR